MKHIIKLESPSRYLDLECIEKGPAFHFFCPARAWLTESPHPRNPSREWRMAASEGKSCLFFVPLSPAAARPQARNGPACILTPVQRLTATPSQQNENPPTCRLPAWLSCYAHCSVLIAQTSSRLLAKSYLVDQVTRPASTRTTTAACGSQ